MTIAAALWSPGFSRSWVRTGSTGYTVQELLCYLHSATRVTALAQRGDMFAFVRALPAVLLVLPMLAAAAPSRVVVD